MNTEKYFDAIEKYFEGQMSATEAATFEAEMAKNPALKATVENYQIADEAIEVLIESSLRAELKDLRQAGQQTEITDTSQTTKKEAKVINMRPWIRNLSIAASVALLVGFFTFQYMDNQYSNEQLMQANYGEVNFSTLRGVNPDNVDNAQLVLEEATAAWEAENYERVIELVQGIPMTDDYYAKAQYMLGHSLYQQGDYKNATIAFDSTVAQEDEKYTDNAQWYAILSAIGADEAMSSIQERLEAIISDTGHGFEQQARDLRQDLGSFWR